MKRSLAWVPIVALVIAVACTGRVSVEEQIRQGDQLAADGKEGEALVAYRNAVRADQRNGLARLKLGRFLAKSGDWRRATDELVRAADLLPADSEAQLDAARGLLNTGRFEDARTRAEAVLKAEPKNVDAHILRAAATAQLRDTKGALESLNQALELDPARSSIYLDVGAVQAAQGKQAEAEAAFKQAVVVGPKSVPAHLALANFYWLTNRRAEAEQALKKAVELEPQHVPANLALARVLAASDRGGEAEAPLKRIAGDSAPASLRLILADYYVGRKQGDQAVSILRDLMKRPESEAAAGARLAAIEYEAGRRDAAHKMLDELTAKRPSEQLSVLKGRWLLSEGKRREALDAANTAVKIDARSADAWAFLGTVRMALNDPTQAEAAYTETLKLNPSHGPAQVAMATLATARGRNDQAVTIARQAVESSPGSGAARLALANAQLASGNVDGADATLRPVIAAAPNSPEVLILRGRVQMRKGENEGARASFTKALELQPGLPDALMPLLSMDLAEKKPAQAAHRLETQLAAGSGSARLQVLAGRTYAATGDLAKSEAALRKAIELDPSLMEAYHVLGQIFVRQKKLGEAIVAYEARIAERPDDVGAHTMIGMLALVQGKSTEARARFEKVLAIDSRAPVASNNLAYMDAEAGTNLDIALNRAQTAKAALPDDPDVNDTLGWVYVKRGLPALAVTPLREGDSEKRLEPALSLPSRDGVRELRGQGQRSRHTAASAAAVAVLYRGGRGPADARRPRALTAA